MNPQELKDYILNNLFTNNRFNGMKFKSLPNDIKLNITQNYRTPQEAIYNIINDSTPKICSNSNCNNMASFTSISTGYGNYCSGKCVASRDKSKDIIIPKTYPNVELYKDNHTIYNLIFY